jgi:hypothetical protein
MISSAITIHPGRQLAAEDREITRFDWLGAAEPWFGFGLDHGRGDALLAQLRAQQVCVLGQLFALHHHAALVAALPDELHHRVQSA